MEKGQGRRVFRKMEAVGEKSEGEGIETDGAQITAEKREGGSLFLISGEESLPAGDILA